MKTIIAGSRTITNYQLVEDAVKECGWDVSYVISGHANGVDKLGEIWAANNNIICHVIPADWDIFGRKAGFLRNIEMAKKSEALVLIWDGKSKGSKMMLEIAKRKGLMIYEKVV